MYYTIHPVLRGVRTLGEDGGPEIQLGRPDIFFPALSVSLHIHPFILPLVLLYILFHSCCFHLQVFGETLVHEFHTSFSILNETCSRRSAKTAIRFVNRVL